ncbi:hypothetical protein ACGF07_14885 [Kitasatospora sp. NPDC048194]|uniref:hypothetical protein n=1 Tax=Kitasatospora sp. NPDC048194 TaxID=3364045 RepID=UPI003714E37B
MDSGIREMVDALEEARRQLRENALPKVRELREPVAVGGEHHLLGPAADLLAALAELLGGVEPRVTSSQAHHAHFEAAKRLQEQAGYLRGRQQEIRGLTG